jgi:hypothetical protein
MKKLFSILLSLNLILTPVALAQQGQAEVDAYKETGTGSAGGYDFYSKQVLVLATSSLGASILTQCPGAFKLPSMITFMSGSVVNIIGEIALGKASNEAHKRKLSEIKIAEEKLAKKGGEFQSLDPKKEG